MVLSRGIQVLKMTLAVKGRRWEMFTTRKGGGVVGWDRAIGAVKMGKRQDGQDRVISMYETTCRFR